MVYIKRNFGDVEIKSVVYQDEFYTQCPTCKKEMQLDTEQLIGIIKDGDLASTITFCSEECVDKYENEEEKQWKNLMILINPSSDETNRN